MPRPSATRLPVLPVLAVLGVLAGGCTDEPDGPGGADDRPGPGGERNPTIAADDAYDTYGTLAEEVAEELAAAAASSVASDEQTWYGVGDDGVCEFSSAEHELPVWFGLEEDHELTWDEVADEVESVLPHGWTVGEAFDLPGGWTGLDAVESATGAVLEVRAKGTSTVRVVAPVTGECGEDASSSPAP
ncbi:hypothetical protein [Nocardioides ferulae]|uniref:hypothetical protein n=1 Tax=Nocardioides ferulae TaxID=2340821 RepID=UPI000F8935FC|nr:hypothetical protein [Nocardioides ferulae]